MDMCDGVVTRVDPRNGTKSTIDLAVCNTFMMDKVEKWKLMSRESGNSKGMARM